MKYLVVLLFISVVYCHPHPPVNGTFPAFYFGDNEVEDDFFDTNKIGTGSNDATLECRTDLDECCSMSQGFHRGNWFFPWGERLELSSSYAMYQSRHDRMVKLHRPPGLELAEGEYCCKIETIKVHRPTQAERFIGEKKCIKLANFTKDCPPFAAPENGQVNIHGNGHGSVAVTTCNNGHNMIGERNATCKAGEWDGGPPICKDSCLVEGKEYSDCGEPCPTTCETYDNDSVVCTAVPCESGCFCKNGHILNNGTCTPAYKCPEWCCEPELENGHFDVTGYSGGDTLNYTCDDGFGPVGPTKGTCRSKDRTWSINPQCRGCAIKLYIMAFTSTLAGGGSDQHHDLFILFKNGTNITIPFYNLQGNDMDTNKGDLWTFVLSDHNIGCVSDRDFKKIAIVESNADNWHIESVMCILSMNTRRGVRYVPLTIDIDANRWIDRNRPGASHFNLTNYGPTRDCPPRDPPPTCPPPPPPTGSPPPFPPRPTGFPFPPQAPQGPLGHPGGPATGRQKCVRRLTCPPPPPTTMAPLHFLS